MNKIILLTGGGRSGKSARALSLASKYRSRAFIATAQSIDREMGERIARHKQERAESFFTIEEPVDLETALQRVPVGTEVAIIDCVAVWVGNLMHHCPNEESASIDRMMEALGKTTFDLIVVTNEVGMGIIPDNEMSRRYRDLLGLVNQRVAQVANEVILMVSGIPLYLKGVTVD